MFDFADSETKYQGWQDSSAGILGYFQVSLSFCFFLISSVEASLCICQQSFACNNESQFRLVWSRNDFLQPIEQDQSRSTSTLPLDSSLVCALFSYLFSLSYCRHDLLVLFNCCFDRKWFLHWFTRNSSFFRSPAHTNSNVRPVPNSQRRKLICSAWFRFFYPGKQT